MALLKIAAYPALSSFVSSIPSYSHLKICMPSLQAQDDSHAGNEDGLPLKRRQVRDRGFQSEFLESCATLILTAISIL